MRFSVTGMATGGVVPRGVEGGRDVLCDLRGLRGWLEGVGLGGGKEVGRKMEVMRACVEKVEGAVCGMIVRGRERPRGWVPVMGGEGRRG